jgi:hypothetical protein
MEMEQEFREINGLNVLVSGPVVIECVRHRIENYFVYCNPGLNSKSWGTTEQKSICHICFPDFVQGELF